MIIYSRVSGEPATEPVTIEEVKAHLKIDGDDEDSYLTSLIKVARKLCESYSGLSFITQTRIVKLDRFYSRDVILPYGPVSVVTAFAYINEDDSAGTITDGYTLDTQSGLAKVRVTESWPYTNQTLNNVSITYTAGYGDADDVPEVIKHAIKMVVATLYENRQDEIVGSTSHMVNYSAQMLLDTVKVYWNAEQC